MRFGRACSFKKASVLGSSFSGRSVVGKFPWRVVVQPRAAASSSASATIASHSDALSSGTLVSWMRPSTGRVAKIDASGDGFALMAYLPATAAAVHMLCSSDGRTKVEWPKQASDEHYKQLQNEHILQSLQLGAPAEEKVPEGQLSEHSQVRLVAVEYLPAVQGKHMA